jgi:mannose-6-phosphate isomerase-like protein (cupin superfamily)
MPRMKMGLLVTSALALFLAIGAARSLDPAVVNPHTVNVTLENEHVRVFEAVLKPGEKEALHSHPRTVVYVIEGGRMRNHPERGTATESELTAGQTMYREPLTHWAENIGTTTMRLVVVELKEKDAK